MDRCGIPPVPDSALRGVTLEDPKYLDYCQKLHENGFEICLHGASAGNNTREYTLNALDFLERHFGRCDTFICHAKNADNLYWEGKVTSLPVLRRLLKWYCRHECSGEVEQSPYFWGDLCKERINQVRLFRTRRIDTLKSNPSMPYFNPHKLYVKGWFTATKRRIIDCATPQARAMLKCNYGLTVLYQYLFRYTDPHTLKIDPRFTQAICDIIDDREILVDTVSHIMQRLRLIQGLFLAYDRDRFWLVNINKDDVANVQIVTPSRLRHVSSDHPVSTMDDGLLLPVVPGSQIVSIETGRALAFEGARCKAVDRHQHAVWKLPFGTLFANLSESPWEADLSVTVKPHSFIYQGSLPFSCLTASEEIRLVLGQMWIIAREILFKGRHFNVDKFLDDTREIRLEDHDNW
jgi:hypothetical protein